MKIISLNVWGGRLREELLTYLKEFNDYDIILLQEATWSVNENKLSGKFYSNCVQDILALFPEHEHIHFTNNKKGWMIDHYLDEEMYWGLAVLSKQPFEAEDIQVFEPNEEDAKISKGITPRYLQIVDFQNIRILNYHGIWMPGGNSDNPRRIAQSEKILEFMNENTVLIGDLNLWPKTKSLELLNRKYRNLIEEYNITTTRTEHFNWPITFADYCFVGKDIEVISFEVPNITVSDHRPMLLEIKK